MAPVTDDALLRACGSSGKLQEQGVFGNFRADCNGGALGRGGALRCSFDRKLFENLIQVAASVSSMGATA